jgi:hypothetical protein
VFIPVYRVVVRAGADIPVRATTDTPVTCGGPVKPSLDPVSVPTEVVGVKSSALRLALDDRRHGQPTSARAAHGAVPGGPPSPDPAQRPLTALARAGCGWPTRLSAASPKTNWPLTLVARLTCRMVRYQNGQR